MGYQRFPPPDDLRDLVEHVWLVESPPLRSRRQEILIPNGRPGLAIALADPGTRHDPVTRTEWPNAASVSGIMTRPQVIGQLGTSSYVGVEFKPWGIAALGLSDLLVDEVLQLSAWVGASTTAALTDDLRAEPFGQSRADRLTNFLQPRLTNFNRPIVTDAVRMIDEARGRTTVADLAGRSGTSYSTLYRVFRQSVGIGPKQYAEIVRYYHFVGGLLGGPADAQATLSALHGYYDQAHAARDFKRYTGVSATSFLAVQDGIAALMHGRSVQDGTPPGR